MMKTINKTALVPYSAQQMYDLVNNVEAYPEFLPWCSYVNVLYRGKDSLKATVGISQGKLSQSFTTHNSMLEGTQIEMRLVEGPFKHLNGKWQFIPVGDVGCEVSLAMEFEFSNSLLSFAFGKTFNQFANTLVDAFCKRAPICYGKS